MKSNETSSKKIKTSEEELQIDFCSADWLRRLERSTHSKELLRDCLKTQKHQLPQRVIDAGAGLGRDAFMMAYWGHRVLSFEKESILFDKLQRAWSDFAQTNSDLANKIDLTFEKGDFFEKLRQLPSDTFDVLYLDPMYPEQKHSALPHKEMQILRALGCDSWSDELLARAVFESYSKGATKIILKRPRKLKALFEIYPEIKKLGPCRVIQGASSKFEIMMKVKI